MRICTYIGMDSWTRKWPRSREQYRVPGARTRRVHHRVPLALPASEGTLSFRTRRELSPRLCHAGMLEKGEARLQRAGSGCSVHLRLNAPPIMRSHVDVLEGDARWLQRGSLRHERRNSCVSCCNLQRTVLAQVRFRPHGDQECPEDPPLCKVAQQNDH